MIDEMDIGNLFNTFDKNKDGRISTEEFLFTIIGEMNEKRREVVEKAFQKIDAKKAGVVNVRIGFYS